MIILRFDSFQNTTFEGGGGRTPQLIQIPDPKYLSIIKFAAYIRTATEWVISTQSYIKGNHVVGDQIRQVNLYNDHFRQSYFSLLNDIFHSLTIHLCIIH